MKFMIDDKPSFELPLESVCQTSMNKNEVHLEFHPNDEADVQLVEMRFFVPPSANGDMLVDDADSVKARSLVCLCKHRILCLEIVF